MSQTLKLVPLPLILANLVMSFLKIEDDTYYFGVGIIGLWEDCIRVPKNQMTLLMCGVCEGGYYKLAKHLIDEEKIGVNLDTVVSACRGGNLKLIDYIINHVGDVAVNSNCLSFELCYYGRLKEMEYLVNKHHISISPEHGLDGACKGDQLHMAINMVSLGATNFNEYLRVSCHFNSPQCIKYMIDSGATFCANCNLSACDHRVE